MNKIKFIILLFTTFVAGLVVAHAQQLEYAGGGNIGDGKFQLVYQLSSADNGGKLKAPAISGAKLIYQSSPVKMGQSSSTIIINGKVVEDSHGGIYRYTLTYKAEKEGTLKVGDAVATVNGKKFTAKGFTFNASQQRPQQQSLSSLLRQRSHGMIDPEDPFTQTDEKTVGPNDIIVRVEMSKPHVYEQQAVVCTIKLYTKFNFSNFLPIKQSEFTGFLIEDITPKYDKETIEQYNGQKYYTAILRKCILYPQKSGTLTINSGEYEVKPVQRQVYVGLNTAIAVPVEGDKLRIKSNASSVKIDPLPTPAPAGFTGAVGEFNAETLISPEQLKTYATATYNVKISGTGNIKYIKAPAIEFPKEFDTYDAQNKINVSGESGDVSGDVTFSYQFTPQHEGNHTIAAWDFVYFNPNTGKYETIHLPEQTLEIGKGNNETAEHHKNKMTDIIGFRDGSLQLQKNYNFLVDSLTYHLCYALPLLIFLGILIYYRKLVKERANVKLMRTKRAGKVAQRRLKQARNYKNAHQREAFYTEVLRATWGYLSDKLAIPVSELSKDNIAAELTNYGAEPPIINATMELLNKCEFAQYAPELESSSMDTVLDEAATVMNKLEQQKKPQARKSGGAMVCLLVAAMSLLPLAMRADNTSQAYQACQQKQYQKALQLYQAELQAGNFSASLYYNMGCAYYKMQHYPEAILYFERALLLNPTDKDARLNLAFTRDKAKIATEGESFFGGMFNAIANAFTSNGWAVVALIAFLMLQGSIAVYIFVTLVAWRKVGFFGAGAWLVVCIFALCCSLHLRNKLHSHSEAIVMTEEATLSTAPHAPSGKEEAFQLSAGEKVSIIDSVQTSSNETWYKVIAPDHREAWVENKHIERI